MKIGPGPDGGPPGDDVREKLLDPAGASERAVDTTLAPGCGACAA
jgi:hypothetical protein